MDTPLIPCFTAQEEPKRECFQLSHPFPARENLSSSVVLSRSCLLRPQKASHTVHLLFLSNKCFQLSSGVLTGVGHLYPSRNSFISAYFFFLCARILLSSVQVRCCWIPGPSGFNADEICVTCTCVQTCLQSSYLTSGIHEIVIQQKTN